MNESILTQLRQQSTVVADTGDVLAIEQHRPKDATTNPTLIQAAALLPHYAELVDETLRAAVRDHGPHAATDQLLQVALDRLAVAFGLRILALIPGRVSTEVDARLSYDSAATVQRAHGLIRLYEAAGCSRERVLIKIAATWEGIRAAEQLEREGIHCNLTLLFGLHQAIACAEAGVTLISPFVGRILDWYRKETGRDYTAEQDPGVVSVRSIYTYLKHFDYRTEVMGASFRNTGEIIALAGCDLLTIAPSLLAELGQQAGTLQRCLDPQSARQAAVERIVVDHATFNRLHTADRMASEKLHEGITNFSAALVALELQLTTRLRSLGLI